VTSAVTAQEVVFPALLRAARGAYGNAVRRALAATGFDDLPQNGPHVLGGMANRGVSLSDLVRQLGVSKQSASQLIDTLVLRGYLERHVNPDDRRRMDVALTDRGRAAAQVVRVAVEGVDEELARRLSPSELAGLAAGLIALTEIREQGERENPSVTRDSLARDRAAQT
jgi:DNA-binding MarR family transcriptional regulator